MKRARQFSFILSSLVMCGLALLAGCGGGASGSNSVISLNQASTATATLQMSNSNLQVSGTATVTANFVNQGQPVSGAQVTFTSTLGTFNPAVAVLTDATGTATTQLLAGNTPGAGIITATATINGAKVTKSITFSVAMPQIVISTPVLGPNTPLAPAGSTSVTVSLTDSNGNPFTTPVDVTFTSNFVSAGKATLLSPVRSNNGVASSTYTAAGGAGTDTITVSVGGASVTTTIVVNGAAANSISYVSATPTSIALKGTGGFGRSESSLVVFKVLDTNGQPKAGQAVDFSLNTTVGGLSLTSSSASSVADGTVSTYVLSGIVSTPVRVTATIHGSSPPISTMSDQLVVSTGIPTQDGFSLAVATLNPGGGDFDGITDVFTARLADHFGNPVPDGTTVYFTAQSGSIDPTCTTANGVCSVTWRSQGLRPPDGMAAILAYAIGEESFTDVNGNGVADGPSVAACLSAGSLQRSVMCGEFTDTTQAFRDDGHTGHYDPPGTILATFPNFPGDMFIDFNGSGKVDRDGIFNGILRPSTVPGPATKHVFANALIVMSTSTGIVTMTSPSNKVIRAASGTPLVAASTALTFSVQDLNTLRNNPMAAGTTFTVTSGSPDCLTVNPALSTFVVLNTLDGPSVFTTSVSNKCAAGGSGFVTISGGGSGGLVFPLTW